MSTTIQPGTVVLSTFLKKRAVDEDDDSKTTDRFHKSELKFCSQSVQKQHIDGAIQKHKKKNVFFVDGRNKHVGMLHTYRPDCRSLPRSLVKHA